LLAGVVAGWGSPVSAKAQDRSPRELAGFAAQLPNIYDQIGLVSTYGFRWLTPENAMKMETVGGCDGVYDFGPADQLLAIAGDLEMRVHGHTLVWHNQTAWCADAYTREDFRAYIQTVTRYYCGKVDSMDVVNEALGKYSGWRRPDESVWVRLFEGNDYIVTAFKWARRSCPTMKLYYNDYLIESGQKAEEMLGLVRMLDDRGLIDGVGFQSHLKLGQIDFDGFAQTMDAVTAMGLEFAISELDIRFGRNYWDLTADDLEAQGEAYRRVAELCLERPGCVRFTVWGLDDGTSWVNHWWEFGPYDDAPLLFDRNWLPKPAYCDGVRPVFGLPRGACG
jgi:endo-1,4-beta-xylanase